MHPPRKSFDVSPADRRRASPDQAPLVVRALIWMAAGSVTLGLHVGLYLAITRGSALPPAPPPELPAAVMINLAPISISARSETDNSADGPEANEREAIQEKIEPVLEQPPPPEPVAPVPPPPPDVKPDAVLPPAPPEQTIAPKPVEKPPEEKMENPPEKPKVEEPKREKPKPVKKVKKPKKQPEKQQKTQAAQKKGGGPRSTEQTGDRSAAQSTGGSSVSDASRASWSSEVRSKIIRAKRYPSEARKRREQGAARVSVTFNGKGAMTSAVLVTSSGSAALDEEAVAVMRRISRFPPTPDGKVTTLIIPLNFGLR